MKQFLFYFILFLTSASCAQTSVTTSSVKQEQVNTRKVWTRWWWMGSAVDSLNIRQSLIELDKAGIGGVEITPLYGVKGEEENFLKHLSPEWVNMLNYTVAVADSLNMGVDMVLGTGWPYGGPHVTETFAATNLIVHTTEVQAGESVIIETKPGERERTTGLQAVLAFGEHGDYQDLTQQAESDTLSFAAGNEQYTIYTVFTGKTGQQVKRAAPGGQGFTLDHYSNQALQHYVEPYTEMLRKMDNPLRAVFNDSFEVYGADFTPDFFSEFQRLRGYDLKKHVHLLMSKKNTDSGNRVKSDYRETISDLLQHQFDERWTEWANNLGLKTKLQAHGSPGNLIDLYATADIPECETFGSMPYDMPGFRRLEENIRQGDADPVMLKFSSSAAHIAGKPLVSSESFTWLRDHFKAALSQMKPEAEDLLLNGVNHMFLHGSTYSPDRAAWPGWKFYASVNMNPNNTIWNHAPELFSYLENCQKMLQSGTPDNDILVYWPVYDVWGQQQENSLFYPFKIHSLDEWLYGTDFYDTTSSLISKGYMLDFLSDQFLQRALVSDGEIKLPGGNYKTIVVPATEYMPLNTLQKLIELKEAGASVLFKELPQSVPGFYRANEREQQLRNYLSSAKIQAVHNVEEELEAAGAAPELLVNTGLKFIRRTSGESTIYYLVNHTDHAVNEYIPFRIQTDDVSLYDPETGKGGRALVKTSEGGVKVRIQLQPGQSVFLQTNANEPKDWTYYSRADQQFKINGPFTLEFESGGPAIPAKTTLNELRSWTGLGKEYEEFSGTATYTVLFDKPDTDADAWLLDLGDVRESAKVWLNGEYIGSSWSVPFELTLENVRETNKLTIEVTNLSANRIRAKELRGEEWKIFYEINMVNKDYEEFDATKWQPVPSGLKEPISLIPLTELKQ